MLGSRVQGTAGGPWVAIPHRPGIVVAIGEPTRRQRSLLGSRVDKSLWKTPISLPRAATPSAQLSNPSSKARLNKNSANNLPHVAVSLARSSPGPRVSIPDSAASNPRILNNLGRLLLSISNCSVVLRRHGPPLLPTPGSGLLLAVAGLRSGTSGSSSETNCWSAQVVVEPWMVFDAARVLSLSNWPFPQDSARTRGDPAGLRYSALGAVHRTLTKLQGVQSRLQGGKVVHSFGRSQGRPM